MADDATGKGRTWMQVPMEAAGRMKDRVTDAVTDTVDVVSDAYRESGLQDKVTDFGTWTQEQLDRTGIPTAVKTVAEKTTDAVDTVSGQKILNLMEERNALQDKYNDVLATKLEEALRRIESLEKLVAGKSR